MLVRSHIPADGAGLAHKVVQFGARRIAAIRALLPMPVFIVGIGQVVRRRCDTLPALIAADGAGVEPLAFRRAGRLLHDLAAVPLVRRKTARYVMPAGRCVPMPARVARPFLGESMLVRSHIPADRTYAAYKIMRRKAAHRVMPASRRVPMSALITCPLLGERMHMRRFGIPGHIFPANITLAVIVFIDMLVARFVGFIGRKNGAAVVAYSVVIFVDMLIARLVIGLVGFIGLGFVVEFLLECTAFCAYAIDELMHALFFFTDGAYAVHIIMQDLRKAFTAQRTDIQNKRMPVFVRFVAAVFGVKIVDMIYPCQIFPALRALIDGQSMPIGIFSADRVGLQNIGMVAKNGYPMSDYDQIGIDDGILCEFHTVKPPSVKRKTVLHGIRRHFVADRPAFGNGNIRHIVLISIKCNGELRNFTISVAFFIGRKIGIFIVCLENAERIIEPSRPRDFDSGITTA